VQDFIIQTQMAFAFNYYLDAPLERLT